MAKKFLVSFIFVLFFAFHVGALDLIFGQHVSQIRAESRNNLVRISWVDSPDLRGPVYIYRSARPFTGSVPANIRPITVRYGMQYYIDDVEDMTAIFYFIAASDVSGQRYEMIVPNVNSINVNLLEPEAPVVQPPPPAAVTEPAGILIARQDGERVVLNYRSTSPWRNPVLYRSAQPVRQPQDLLNAVLVHSGVVFPFIDLPVPGTAWYYTVVYEDEITSGNLNIRPGVNSTTYALAAFGGAAEERTIRPTPLPNLTLNDIHAQRMPLGAESINILNSFPAQEKAGLELRRPRVFAVDLDAPAGGEESALFQILKDYFEPFDWEGSRVNLQSYLSQPRSNDVEARARFYLGQALYFTGHYREALFEFLTVRSLHPNEANAWIEAVLSAMVH